MSSGQVALDLQIGKLSEGTKVTAECARSHGKHFIVVQLDKEPQCLWGMTSKL
jgi:hypothetical protein